MITINKMEVEANPSSEIDECILDCIKLSYTEKCDVVLKHNSMLYSFRISNVLKCIEKSYETIPKES